MKITNQNVFAHLWTILSIVMAITLAGFAKAQVTEHKLTASDGEEFNWFGRSVSLSKDRALIGAIFGTGLQDYSGSAYIYEQQGDGSWLEVAKLTASDGAENDRFGWAVSLSEYGNRALVGANTDDNQIGSAYVFERKNNGSWKEVTKLYSSEGEQYDWFGCSVSLSGDRALIGADWGPGLHENSGSAYIFERRNNVSWIEVAKLTASDGADNDLFGESVSLIGDRALVGAFGDDDLGVNSGSAYVFERQSDGSWEEVAKLTASDGEAFDWFGRYVSLSNSGYSALVGAPFGTGLGVYSGAAYLFERQGDGSWLEVAKLTPFDGAQNDRFGLDVQLSKYGDRALIGAMYGPGLHENSGSAYVFEQQGDGSWIQVGKLTASDGEEFDMFGGSVSLFGDQALVGAFWDDDLGINSGSAYMFDNLSSLPIVLIANLIDNVADLVNTGLLEEVHGKALTKKLNDAIQHLYNENAEEAINKIYDFINQVQDLINSGKISQWNGQQLINAAEEIIDNIQGVLPKQGEELVSLNGDPYEYKVYQNYPNPFNPKTTIHYDIPTAGFVTLKVYDMLGLEVTTLVEEYRDEGRYEINFDAIHLASGVYIYQLRANNYIGTMKMILMK